MEIADSRKQSRISLTQTDARMAWRQRVARLGSLIQIAFAAFWFLRAPLATNWAYRLPIAIILAGCVITFGIWAERKTRGMTTVPTGVAAQRLGRQITIATILQLAASFILPEIVIVLGRPDLIIGSISVTIGILLLWLWMKLGTPVHLVAGALLIATPVFLASILSGSGLTASTGFLTGAVLVTGAFAGIESLLH